MKKSLGKLHSATRHLHHACEQHEVGAAMATGQPREDWYASWLSALLVIHSYLDASMPVICRRTYSLGVDLQKMKCEVYTPPAAYRYIQSLKNINDELGGCYVLTGAGLMGGAIMKKRLINYPTNHLEFADRGLALEYLKSWRNREELTDPAKNCFYALLKIMDEIRDKNVTV